MNWMKRVSESSGLTLAVSSLFGGFNEARMSAAFLGAYIEYLGIDLMEVGVRGTPTLADHFEQTVSMPMALNSIIPSDDTQLFQAKYFYSGGHIY